MFLPPADRGPDAAGSPGGTPANASTSNGGLANGGVANGGPANLGTPNLAPPNGGPGSQGGWLAAPYAETPSFQPTAGRLARARAVAGSALDDLHPKVGVAHASVRSGGCFVRPLPLDSTCAGTARRFFKESVAGMGLPGDLIHDGITMASELAANTLNAHGNIEYGGHGHRAVSGIPEFWLYVRTCGPGSPGREIVCKIFDSDPGWDAGEPVPIGAAVPAGPDSVRGRGLQMVAGLSAGMWGHHLTRGRLGVWKVPGKAVWFALRVPATSELARSERLAPRGSEAIEELVAALAERGLGTGLVPVTEPGGDLAVLSVSHKLTVWCQNQILWWRDPDGTYDRLTVTDMVEATERIVAAHEELVSASQPSRPADRAQARNSGSAVEADESAAAAPDDGFDFDMPDYGSAAGDPDYGAFGYEETLGDSDF
jgi:hypothetical protein